MKTKKESRKELTAKILDKIQEAFSGVNDKAVKKIKRSAETSAKKLAKKITATVDKITKKEKIAASKAKKKEAKKQKKVNKPLTVDREKVAAKTAPATVTPAPVKAKKSVEAVAVQKSAVPVAKATTKKAEAAPITEVSSNGAHKDENKEA